MTSGGAARTMRSVPRHALTQAQQRFYKELGDRIRQERTARNLMQADLARYLGLNRTSITNIERGSQQLLVHHLCALADIFSLEVADLLPSVETRAALGAGDATPTIDLPPGLKRGERQWILKLAKRDERRR